MPVVVVVVRVVLLEVDDVVVVEVAVRVVVVVTLAPRTQARPWNPNAVPNEPLQDPVPVLPWYR